MMTELILGTITLPVFLFLYKRTHKLPFLFIATLAWIRILSGILIGLPAEYFIPLYMIGAVFLAQLMYQHRHYWLIMILGIEFIFYLYMMLFTTFRMPGMTEVIYSILCLLWYNVYHDELCIDPWKCG